jgi:tRNA A-37 threonylcarbamoyl transferase component Bud32
MIRRTGTMPCDSQAAAPVYELRLRAGRARAVGRLAPEDLRQALLNPEALVRANCHRPVKLSHSCLMVEAELVLEGVATRVAYKRSRPRSWWKALAAVVRGNRTRRAWKLSRLLVERGIPTAAPVLLCEPRRGWLSGESFLATRWIEGSLNLHLYLWQLKTRPPHERQRRVRQAAASLGALLGRMHASRLSNRDLKGLNLVFVEHADRVDTYLIDPDGVRPRRRLNARVRARDLARLAASLDAHPWITRTDRCRFLRAYQAELAGGAGDWRSFWREIARGSERVKRRLRRQGRPIA